ncbi:MAG: methylated-DNA--[protein]-cysteine S-methyltransferase [Eubacterium sp.]|nr:methylated-DNA--[protein]-cysteine S-methyltransferase [Eubacterium sp.]
MKKGLYDSPLGRMIMTAEKDHLTGLYFEGQKYGVDSDGDFACTDDVPVFRETARWLDLYFNGEKPDFLPPLHLRGSDFRKRVWEILLTIPYGQTMTYGEIAGRIAEEKGMTRMSAQAVGGAVGHNPVGVIVPCHRVLGAGGKLTGYAGGLDRKEWLLVHERKGRESA